MPLPERAVDYAFELPDVIHIFRRPHLELDLPPDACVAIEDSRNGLMSAYQAGIPTIVTPGIYTEGQDFSEAELVVPDLNSVAIAELLAGRLTHESR